MFLDWDRVVGGTPCLSTIAVLPNKQLEVPSSPFIILCEIISTWKALPAQC